MTRLPDLLTLSRQGSVPTAFNMNLQKRNVLGLLHDLFGVDHNINGISGYFA